MPKSEPVDRWSDRSIGSPHTKPPTSPESTRSSDDRTDRIRGRRRQRPVRGPARNVGLDPAGDMNVGIDPAGDMLVRARERGINVVGDDPGPVVIAAVAGGPRGESLELAGALRR